jgi:DNA-binding transcriptional ArsR family regulator
VAGTLTAIAAVGNLIVPRKNLQNAQATLQYQRDIEDRRAQETALEAYFGDITTLVREGLRDEHPLSPIRLLTRGRTVSLFSQLDPGRKRVLLRILYEAGLMHKEREEGGKGNPVIGLSGADLRKAYLVEFNLSSADLKGTDMKAANLEKGNLAGADLRGANLSNAYLDGVDLYDAHLSNTNLIDARGLTNEGLEQQLPLSLKGAQLPNGQKYEEWLKSTGRGEDGANIGAS